MGTPGFWDDQARAASVSTEHARAARKLERYESLRREVDEAAELLELEPELEAEVAEQVAPVREELARLQEEALFDGEYDAGDAVVTITAGAGGTDAQDWAEMLLRMYLRWTAARGFQTEVIEASPGEEAGLKSATVTVRGENAYGLFKAERGVHRLVRLSPFDSAHRRHTAFAQVVVAPLLPDSAEVEIDESDCGSTRTAPAAPAASTSTRPIRPSGSPTCRRGSSCSARTSARRRPTSRRRCGSCARASPSSQRRSAKPSLRGSEAGRSTSGSAARSFVRPAPVPAGQGSPHEPRGRNAQGVLDGALDGFVQAYLLARAAGKA